MPVKILNAMRRDYQRPLRDIAKEIGVPLTTAYDRLNRARDKIIKRTIIPDFRQFGYHSRFYLTLKSDQKNRKSLGDFLISCPHVNSLFIIDSGYDFMIDFIFRDQIEFKFFLEMLKGRFSVESYHCYNVLENLVFEEFQL